MAYSSSGIQSQTQFQISDFNSSIPLKPSVQGKSFKHFLSKSLFFALCVAFLPLFPSEVPDYMDNVIPAKLWEILYFVFIGIAVSYGLFSKKNVQKELETQSYASSMIHSSSFFEDAFEISHGSVEKIRIYGKPSHSIQKNNFEASSMEVLVDRRNKIDYEPMGLPIRSLRSGITNTERFDSSYGSDYSSGSNCSSINSMKCGRREFGNLDPMNLKDTFDEESVSSSPSVPCQSRSGKETREKVDNVSNPSNFWPLSDDEAQNESLKSTSFRSTKSYSFHSSSNHLKDLEVKRGENLSFSKESRLRSSKITEGSPKQNKIHAKGMSVRTIRPKRVVAEAMEVGVSCRNHEKENGREKIDGFGKERSCLINNGNQNLDNANNFSEQKNSKYDEETGKFPNVLCNDSDHESCRKDYTSRVISNEDMNSETEMDNHEVDKKADEFIAKFREQIKLQKTASLTRLRKNNI